MRSRAAEVKDGDRNTAYFHHKSRCRKQRNTIKGIFNEAGVWQDEEKDIVHTVTSFYEKLFCSQGLREFFDVLNYIPSKVLTPMNEYLLAPYSHEEVRNAVFSMKPHKAPGPDRLHAFFFHRYWDTLTSDVVSFVNDFLCGVLPDP